MKKVLAMLLAVVMVMGLAACGSNSTPTTTAAPEVETQPAEQTPSETAGEPEGIQGTGVNLTIYSNSVSDGRGDWLKERAAKDGFKIEYVDAGAADVQNRLLAEAAAPIADVTFGLNAIIWENLKANDILTPYVPVWAGEIAEGLNDPDGYYHAIVKQAILLAYDTNQWTADQAPTDWPDLWTKEEFHGTYEINRKLAAGTTRNVIAGILTRYVDPNGELGISQEGWDNIAQYYQNGVLSEEGVDLYAQIAADNTVVCGQIWSSGIEARDEQYGTKTAYANPEVGVPYAVEGVAIVNGTKNMDEAKRFVDWFGSAQIQGEWAETFSTLPANVNAVDKANAFNQEIATLKAQNIDWALVAANIDQWCEKIALEYMP